MGLATTLLASVINFKTVSLALVVYLIYKAYLLIIKIPLAFKAHFEAQGIPVVPWIPLFGSIISLRNNNKADEPWKEMESRCEKHGRFYVNFFGPYPRLILNSPSHLQDMLVRKNNCYQKSETLRLVLSPLLGNGLVTSEGALWRKQRTIINPAFHFGHLKQMISLMAECTQKALGKWPPAVGGGDTIECHKEFSNLTLDIIASTAFGSSFRDNPAAAHTITHAFTRCLELIQERNFSLIGLLPIVNQLPIESYTQLWNGVHAMQAVVLQILDDRQSAKSFSLCEGKDLLDLLVEARDEKGQPMPRDQMKDELMTFVLAGHETTSNLLTFMALKLSENPDILERCIREVDEVLPNLQTPTYETLKQLHYLDATLDETLRFHPPVAIFNREAIEDNVLTGVDADGKPKDIEIKKGMTINVQIRMLHRDPLLWKDPLKFDPTRFLAQVQGGKTADSAEDVEMLKPRYAPMQFLPFGGGPRSCIGSQFAKLEAKTIMAGVLQRYSLELVPGQKIVDELAITVRPKYGLHVKLVPRNPVAAQ